MQSGLNENFFILLSPTLKGDKRSTSNQPDADFSLLSMAEMIAHLDFNLGSGVLEWTGKR